jgi:hypothetical protein
MSAQQLLDFSRPEIQTNPSLRDAPETRLRTLQAACWRCLARLVEGEARAHELEVLGGRRFGSRLNELRRYLRQQLHGDSWAGSDPIPYPGSGSDPLYHLLPQYLETARQALERRR